MPASTTESKKTSYEPSDPMALKTITVSPAAGPDTLNCEPLANATIIPPTIPEIIPENSGAPDAKAIPKHKGKATKNTTRPAGKSFFKYEKEISWFNLIFDSIVTE